jgi:photosystem II stability/assembly factor-like uncharacterized protein
MADTTAVEVWVGTRKGAFAFRSSKDRKKWEARGPFFGGEEVHHVAQDRRKPERLYAAVGNAWFGSHLHASSDGGKTWSLAENGLTLKGVKLPESKGPATLKRIWHIEPGAADEPGVVYLGAEPGCLFVSRDDGGNWEVVKGLTQHPTRKQHWMPGAGGMMVHSIQALGKGRVVAGISAGGAFVTSDAGKTWTAFNAGVLTDFQAEKFPEAGQCVHKLLAHPVKRDALYQQNHCGVYRTKFGAKKWTDVSKGLPSRFGFALAVPAAEAQTLFTVPIVSPGARHVPEGKLRVGRSRDGGKSWELLTKGLPQKNAYVLVLREAMASDDCDPAGVYFGTSSGTVFCTRDAGDSWGLLAEHLPPVYSVTAALA